MEREAEAHIAKAPSVGVLFSLLLANLLTWTATNHFIAAAAAATARATGYDIDFSIHDSVLSPLS
jgi:hypothetical protein